MAASSSNSNEKADRWYFTKDQLENTPSRKCGYEALKELKYRQQAANFIQEMGQKLKVTQLCINTAIVYMHRFYVFHSFSNFPWHQMASAALFLAAKVEEQPRKLEYVIRVANLCRNPKDTSFDVTSERYLVQSQDLVFNENVLLQTLGFDVAIDHPHTHVVRCCHLVRASKDLAQTSYFMASNSLHLTTMCLQYKPTVVACFCIHVACKWSNWEIPLSNEKKEWFSYVDSTVTAEQLQQLTEEFLVIFGNCSSRLKEKIMAIGDIPHSTEKHLNSPFDTDPKKIIREEPKEHPHRPHESKTAEDPHKHRRPHDQSSSSQQQREREYREKKERERLAQAHHGSKPQQPTDPQKTAHAHHHRPPPADAKLKPVRPQPPSNNHPPNPAAAGNLRAAVEPRDILREAARDSPFGIAQPQQNVNKDLVRSDKDKYLVKSNVLPSTDSNSNSVKYPPSAYEKHRVDPNRTQQRPPHDPSKVPSKPFKQENNKQFAGDYASNNKNVPPPGHFNKPPSTSHPKIKTEPVVEPHKSVPNKHYNKPQPQNGSNQPYHPSSATKPIKQEIKVEIPIPAAGIKRPSLFSPEKSPPHMQQQKHKLQAVPPLLTPVESPASHRSRNYSSSSEPELRPVLKKIDTVAGYENILRDNGIKKFENEGIKLEPMTTSLVNGIETNPTLISNLLKETPSISHLSAVSAQLPVKQEVIEEPKEHSHHKSKKKNKEKHKHKDKDRNRDDKEKKKKHKDKDREKHKKDKSTGDPEPIKIKIALPPAQEPPQGLRITIPKDRIQTDSISQPPVKIKISKDVINNCASAADSKKRERSSDSGSSAAPPAKAPRYKEGKPNGRHSYNKVRETHFNRRPHMPPQNNYYPPYPMGQPPMHMPHPMHMQYHPPPNFMYPPQQFYMYPPDMYSQPPPPTGGSNPPLPMDAPPDVPPPPPPE